VTKRILTTVVMAGLLAGCSAPGAMMTAPAAGNVAAQAAASKFLTADKADTAAKQTTKNKLGNKADSKTLKTAAELKIALKPATLAPSLTESSISSIARMTLNSMQQARTYDSGCQIAYGALERMLDETNQNDMAVRFTYYGAKSQEKWVNAYKVAALGLEHIANGRSSTGRPLYQLAQSMMGATDSWVDGAKVGYEMLETIEKVDRDSQNRRIASFAYDSAKRATRWEDAYRTIDNAFREIASRSW
jgi:hypothetical protein